MAPIVGADVVFEEQDGLVAVEAEHFFKQEKTQPRAWHVFSSAAKPKITPDGDPPHVAGAAGGAYIEALPDTRRTHGDKLIHGQNFQNTAGLMAILHYKVHVKNPGRYYVWARTHSTGTEDNGLHVGIDGEWPESGQRMQWTAKNKWSWDSKQRTQKVHTGVPGQLFLDIDKAGEHVISFSMREDGFEFDRWLMTRDREFKRPAGVGPTSLVKSGTVPKPFKYVKPNRDAMQIAEVKISKEPLVQPREEDGNGTVAMSGLLRQWHNIELTLSGPYAHESDNQPNPFTDYRFEVRFTHESGTPNYTVPGYFAADGNAANSSAKSGTKWRAHLAPDKPGNWNYRITFQKGKHAAVDETAEREPVALYDGRTGQFIVNPVGGGRNQRAVRDFRRKGRLQYVGKHYLRFAGSGDYFIKAGPDAPETLLGYADFDDTVQRKKKVPLKTWKPHVADWKKGNPTWKDGKGKGLIGAMNYLAQKGCNSFSFLPYNAAGDGDNVWPFVSRNDKFHYDCSKLDQWGIVFDHAQSRGLFLHFKLQENEMDDNRRGTGNGKGGPVKTSLDGGKLGPERKLYLRELIARYGHAMALNWNLGEENTQSPEEQRDMAKFIHDTDPYNHLIVVHTYPNQQDKVYSPLIGDKSVLTGASLQNPWDKAHQRTLKWVRESAQSGRKWVVCNDEQNPASMGVPPDPGYEGHDGFGGEGKKKFNLHDIRKSTLWGTLMAGGAGVEYYFGYQLPQNDLLCEDFRSRDKSWNYCRIAIQFFEKNKLPLDEMKNADELVGNNKHDNSAYCFAKSGEIYLVYLPNGGSKKLDLSGQSGGFTISWFNPRKGGKLVETATVTGGEKVQLGEPPSDTGKDWLAVVRKK